jgi:hypothetical protein
MSKLQERVERLSAIRDFTVDATLQKQQLVDYLEQQRMLYNADQYQEIARMPAQAMPAFIDFLIGEMRTTMWGRHDWATEMDETAMRAEDPDRFHAMVVAANAANRDVQAVMDDDPEKGYKLVAKRHLPASTRIPYTGKTIAAKEADYLTANYTKQIQHRNRTQTVVGDVYPRDRMNMAAFANDKDLYRETEIAPGRGNKMVSVTRYESGHTNNNAELVHDNEREEPYANLLQDVVPGEEISIRYGGSYWNAGGEVKKKGQK